MSYPLTSGELQNALALSQAACYASMSAKEHPETSEQGAQMLRLTTRLVDMTLAALDGTAPDVQPLPGEPTLADIVEQTKTAAAAGQPAPQVVVDLTQPEQPQGFVARVEELAHEAWSHMPGVHADPAPAVEQPQDPAYMPLPLTPPAS